MQPPKEKKAAHTTQAAPTRARKVRPAIGAADIAEYLAGTSDFAFEISVGKALSSARFEGLTHAWTYLDPVTGKIRSYDFRGTRLCGETQQLRVSVECTNVRDFSPLLVYATRRRQDESYHTLIHRRQFAHPISRTGQYSAYRVGEFVGRFTDQVSKNNEGGFKSSDAAVYEKHLQALHSAQEIIRSAAVDRRGADCHIAIVPLLVIPDGRLWQIDYEDDGTVAAGPRELTHTTLYVGHSWATNGGMGNIEYKISHLEITTLSELTNTLDDLVGSLFVGV